MKVVHREAGSSDAAARLRPKLIPYSHPRERSLEWEPTSYRICEIRLDLSVANFSE